MVVKVLEKNEREKVGVDESVWWAGKVSLEEVREPWQYLTVGKSCIGRATADAKALGPATYKEQ